VINEEDQADIRRAKELLESTGLTIRMANYLGRPIAWGLETLSKRARDAVLSVTRKSMEVTLDAALLTLQKRTELKPRNWPHRLGVMTTGALGGFFGPLALAVELPISTAIMFRSIAAHARSQGESLLDADTQLNCLSVFALGGTTAPGDAKSGYLAVRASLANVIAEAVEYVTERGAAESEAPALATFIARLAARFAPAVGDKVAAQLVPAIGAAGGAAINLIFIEHFQGVAWGHFTVRRLERKYGVEAVGEIYAAP